MDIYADDPCPLDVWGPDHVDTLPDDLPKPMLEADEGRKPRTGYALKLTRAALGLSAQDFATYLGVGLRTVQRWEKQPLIPDFAETALRELIFHTEQWVAALDDADLIGTFAGGWRMVNERPLPESWWLTIVGRALYYRPHTPVVMK